jgi:hypothetical protein
MTSIPSKDCQKSVTVDKEEFERIIGNLLKMPPKEIEDDENEARL